ncbi:MAG: thiamine phosphate synthase [Gammaproteobacteria bacterium]
MNGIYAITPPSKNINIILEETKRLLDEGVLIFQYREKNIKPIEIAENAFKLLELIKKNNGTLIINDSPQIAMEIGADGFHLGQEDYSNNKMQKFLKEHQETLNQDYIKGISCKWDLEFISNLPEDIIIWDYIAVGAFYSSSTKKNALVKETVDRKKPFSLSSKHIVAIGGIDHLNFKEVLSIGYETIAMSSGVFFNQNSYRILNYFKE